MKKSFELQEKLVKKVENFLTYLVMVKQTSAWRPHQSVEDIRLLQD